MVTKVKELKEDQTVALIDQVLPNPYQPDERQAVDNETAERFGKSILEHGLLQTPIGRLENGRVELGDGWLRLSGYKWLVAQGHEDYRTFPIALREFTDQEMADLVIEANTVRKDLTPIGEAKLYKRYLEEFAVTQAKLAEAHNISQGELANKIRLLELPEDVQEKISSREITPTHGRTVLPLRHMPGLLRETLKNAIQYNSPVNQVEGQVRRVLWDNSCSLDPKEGYTGPAFDLGKCESCENKATLRHPYQDMKETRCTDRACWNGKQQRAVTEKAKKDKAKLQKQGISKVFSRHQLKYGEYESLSDYNMKKLDKPEECNTCEKKAATEGYRPGEVEPICLDPKCYRLKQLRKTKADNKIAREEYARETARLTKVAKASTDDLKVAMRVVAELALRQARTEATKDIVQMFGFRTDKSGRSNINWMLHTLDENDVNQLIQIVVGTFLCIARHDYGTTLTKALVRLEGKTKEYEDEIRAFQENNCKGCRNATEERLAIPEKGCSWGNRVDEEGRCRDRTEKRSEVTDGV